MTRVKAAGLIAITLLAGLAESAQAADESECSHRNRYYILRQDSTTCNLFTRGAASWGVCLGDYHTRKQACEAAKSFHSPPAPAPGDCVTYGYSTINACKAEGIDLP
jgi:hypothetical protein